LDNWTIDGGEKLVIFNQYSAIWLAAFLLVIAGVILLRRRSKWHQVLAFAILVLALVIGWIFLHPSQSSQINNAAQVQASIGGGTPVLLEFQSPY